MERTESSESESVTQDRTYCLKSTTLLIIIIITIIIIIISFMQGSYNYIPETNYVPREYSVVAILL